MGDFFKSAYDFELDRKTKLYSALPIPIGIATVSMAIVKYVFENLNFNSRLNVISLASLSVCLFCYARVFVLIRPFIDYGAYEVICYADHYRDHLLGLKNFSIQYPDAPPAEETFETHLINDYSKCASINAAVNDRRSQILYDLNLTVYVLILFAMISAAMIMLEKIF